jgi:hypothetical protein
LGLVEHGERPERARHQVRLEPDAATGIALPKPPVKDPFKRYD